MNSRSLGHLASSWGPAALLANNILLYLVLAWLAHSSPDPFDRTLLLAIGNLGLACVLFAPQFRNGPLLLSRTTTFALLGWCVAYSITYGAFVRWPELIPVWGLLAAKACGPLIAVFVSGDHRRDAGSFRRRIVLSSPIVLLVAIAFLEWKSSSHAVIAALVALGLIALFAFIGRKLVAFATEHAEAVDLSHVIGFIRKENMAPIKIVESLGWQKVGSIPVLSPSDIEWLYYIYVVPHKSKEQKSQPDEENTSLY